MTLSLVARPIADGLEVGLRGTSRGAATPALPNDLLTAVWQESSGDLARLAATFGLSPADAEDALQDVYVAALREAQRRPSSARELRFWLFRVTINRCRLEHRRRGRWRRMVESFWRWGRTESNESSAAANCERNQMRELVGGALESLTEDLRIPLVLRYFCDFDSRRIGELLEIPDSTVRSRLRAARKLLAAGLIKAGYEHD